MNRRFPNEDLVVASRFLAALPGFLRTSISFDEARRRVSERFRRRSERIVHLLESLALSASESPYAQLLRNAGFEGGDASRLVTTEGVEGALLKLLGAGVFLTCDEFKGRIPVKRGSVTFSVDPETLLNPGSIVHGLAETSGSRGARTPVPIDLAFIEDHAVNTFLTLAAHDGTDWAHAHFGIPGGTSVTNQLEFAKGGMPPERWFTPVDPGSPGLHPRYRWGSRAMWIASRLAAVPLPSPTFAPYNDLSPVVQWLARVLDERRIPHLWTFSSAAVLVCEQAERLGIDIAGTRFTAGGEPTTPARREAVERRGGVVIPRMGTTETDILSYACPASVETDDMHFFTDRHVLVQPGADSTVKALSPQALLLTSLLPTAPITLLNVCLGDQADLSERDCGCLMSELGWRTHIANVRSFEKLTAGGVTLLDTDVLHVLEEVLPAHFGGAPTDYQLLERLDDHNGHPIVELHVHPRVNLPDYIRIRDVFLEAVGGGTGGEKLMELLWRGADLLSVVRSAPKRTQTGKILHIHHDH